MTGEERCKMIAECIIHELNNQSKFSKTDFYVYGEDDCPERFGVDGDLNVIELAAAITKKLQENP